MDELETSLIKTLSESDLSDLGTELADKSIDAVLDDAFQLELRFLLYLKK